MEKKCSKCGTVFICQHETKGCWCEQFSLSNETLRYLTKHYEKCLCPQCLHEFSWEKQGSVANENQ